ncbi:hypothetical protein [Galbibacter orientalis]|uniref:hypothetical protein n=1 Tax=Galbibacter orientalis TaxID=453852 RepID=UPI0030807E0B
MKTIIIIGLCLLGILLLFTNCAQIVGGISKKQASKNLEEYLEREYNGELTYKNLNRFFNAATMNPNSFSVHIYHKKNPDIEFYTHFDAKKILIADYIASYHIEFNDLYQKALKYHEAKQAVIVDFKSDILDVKYGLAVIELIFKEALTSDTLEEIITKFVDKLNASYDVLNNGYEHSLLVKTPSYPEGFITVPLKLEDNMWKVHAFHLSENVTNFELFKIKIENNIQTKLELTYPYYKISEYRKIFLDKSSLSKGAWVQYLEDTRINNKENEKYQNPLKGIYIVYFDLESRFIYRGEMLTEKNDITTSNKELKEIRAALAFYDIRTE